MVFFLKKLEPRQFTNVEEMIQEQFEEVHEVLFITSGTVLVGYRLFKESYWAKLLKNRAIIGAFPCMINKVSEFLYKPMELVQGFAIKKENFRDVLRDKVGAGIGPKIRSYYYRLRKIVYSHRDIEARKFKTMIDYVDLSAFGVDVEVNDFDNNLYEALKLDEAIKKYTNPLCKLTEKLESLDSQLNKNMVYLCALAQRYDEKMEKIVDSALQDPFQKELLMKIYDLNQYKAQMKKLKRQKTVVEFQEVTK